LRFLLKAAQQDCTFLDCAIIILGFAKLDKGQGIIKRTFKPLDADKALFKAIALTHDLLCRRRVVPEIRILDNSVQLGKTLLGTIPVKDASSAVQWTAWWHQGEIEVQHA
jgi:hypothetical protein